MSTAAMLGSKTNTLGPRIVELATESDDLAHATQLLRATGAIDDTMARARHFGGRAIDALGSFGAGTAKAALTEAVEFAISRAY